MTLRAVASIHDVRPDTLDRVERLIALLGHAESKIALLVVPGLDWTDADIARLRAWADAGYELAGHGWVHRRDPRTLYHWLHALVISRDQAEHLSASRSEVRALVERGREWFAVHGLPAPGFYVPPAWAMGRLRPDDLASLGYAVAETQWGFLDLTAPHPEARARVLSTPLIGFEADTAWRQLALGAFNARQVARARRTGRPLRLGMHPFDLELRRADEARQRIEEIDVWMSTEEAVAALRATRSGS